MSGFNDGGPAFPLAYTETNEHGVQFPFTHPGMSMRDWFAGQVAAGIAAFSGTAGVSYGPGEIAGRAYQVADAMIAAREGGAS
jgi:hypothetical protein